jgi:hypothetical protein
MTIMACLKDTYKSIEAHPWSRPILIAVSIIAIAIIISLILVYPHKIKNYFTNLFENPDGHGNGLKIFCAVTVIAVVGPIFGMHFFCKKKKLCCFREDP